MGQVAMTGSVTFKGRQLGGMKTFAIAHSRRSSYPHPRALDVLTYVPETPPSHSMIACTVDSDGHSHHAGLLLSPHTRRTGRCTTASSDLV